MEFVAGAFPTRQAGWLLGGTPAGMGTSRAEVWHTDAAGASWRLQWKGPGNARSIGATDPRHAWALIGCAPSGRDRGCRSELMGTADGGAIWRRLSWLPATANLVQFNSASFGIVTADASCLDVTSPSRCPGQLLVSDDGGARWSTVLRSADPLYATAGPGTRLWAAQVVPGFEGKGGSPIPEIRFLTSADDGRSWQSVGELTGFELLSASTMVHLAAGAGGLEWAGLFDQQDCAMHGCGTAALYHSTNGGRAWRIADLYGELSEQCSADGMVFSRAADGTVWAATGQNGGACQPPFGTLYRHDRSGWRQLPPWQLAGASALVAVNRDVAYAISDESALVRTDDGGAHWVQLLPAPAPTGQLDALDQQTALAVQDATNAGAVLRSMDGGRSWQQIADLPGIITQLDFPSSRNGVALTLQVDRRGRAHWRLWLSRDGGQSWGDQGQLFAHLHSLNSGVWGPWISGGGHGVLLTIGQTIAWEELASGGVGPVQEWTSDDWGAHWRPGSLLPVGNNALDGDTLGQASFLATAPGHWLGWIIHSAGVAGWRIEAITNAGRTLSPVRHSPAGTGIQLVGRSTGFAWSLESNGAAPVVSLYRTTDAGQHWYQTRILTPGAQPPPAAGQPFVDFTDPQHGWLLVGASSWHSSDGGRSWHPAY